MAKKTIEEDIVINNVDEVIIQADAIVINEVPEVLKAVNTASVNMGVKMVKVTAMEDVDCIIARMPYKIAKDKYATIPSDVAAILVNARKVYRQ